MSLRFTRRAAVPAMLLLAAACNEPAPQEEMAEAAPPPAAAEPEPAPSGDAVQSIPEAFLGRWAFNGDCTDGAVGLLRIAPDELHFYESVAKIEALSDVTEERLTAELAFTGEGQKWQETATLRLLDSGERLERADAGGDSPIVYTRCPAGTP